jgi:hypothetical protein
MAFDDDDDNLELFWLLIAILKFLFAAGFDI